MESIYYLKCKNCGHKKNVDSNILDGNLLKLARKSEYELNEYFKKIKSKMLCNSCGINGKVKLCIQITANANTESERNVLAKTKKYIHKNDDKTHATKAKKYIHRDYDKTHDTKGKNRKAVMNIGGKAPVNYTKKKIPEDYVRRIDEGLAGTREGHKRMRGQIWSEIKNRNL